MLVICLNGSINAGKTTVGRLLAQRLADAEFIDGDDHDAPAEAPLEDRIECAIARLAGKVEASQAGVLILANPLREADYDRLASAARMRGARLVVVTLAPPLAVVLADRGGRRLSGGERARVAQMCAEGYHRRAFSDLVLEAPLPAADLADRIATHIGAPG